MVEITDPGRFADALELDLARFRQAALVVRMPPAIGDLADALGHVTAMLREAEDRGQTVDLGDAIVRRIREFRGTLAALGGAPARA